MPKVSVQNEKPENVHFFQCVLSKHFKGNSLEEAGGKGDA